MSNPDYTADLAVIKNCSYSELLCVFRYAPLGIALFSDSLLNTAFSHEMKRKGEALTTYEKASISKVVDENADRTIHLLGRFSEYARTSPPPIKLPPVKKNDKKIEVNQPSSFIAQLLSFNTQPQPQIPMKTKEEIKAAKLAQKVGKTEPATNNEQATQDIPAKAKTSAKKNTDEQDWARLFELSQAIATAKEEQDKIKEKLMTRAVELGLFNEGSKTATFPNGVGKIRVSWTHRLGQPKEVPAEFFEAHDELFELTPDEKRIIDILQSDDEDAVEALNKVGFFVKTSESRTFSKS